MNEAERLAALDRYGILDTGREAAFDDIAELAADILDAPIAVVNFIAADRQWFKAEKGVGKDSLPLDVSICRHAILQPGVFVVPDLTKDARFENNPLVGVADGLRFYAGALLETPDGLPLGTLCVLDMKARPDGISARQERALRTLAAQTMAQLELRRSSAAARQESERLSAMFAQATVGMSEFGLDGRLLVVNDRLCAMLGRSRDELLTLRMADVTHPDDLACNLPLLERLAHTGEGFALDKRYVRPDSAIVWANSSVTGLLDERGQPRAALAVTTDVTARKEEERRRAFLLELGDRTRSLADPEAIVAATTRALGEALGATRVAYAEIDDAEDRATVRGDWTDGVAAHLPQQVRLSDFGAKLIARLRSGGTLRVENITTDPSTSDSIAALDAIDARALVSVPLFKDERLVVNLNVHQRVPRAWSDAEVEFIETVAERTWEAVERARAESTLRESEARFRRMLEIGAVSVVFFDLVGGVTDANDAFLAMTGYTRAELEAGELRYDKLTPPDWRWRDEQTIAELKATGESVPFEKQYTRKDGSRIWIYCSGKMLDGRTAVEFIVDVTARKAAEERRRVLAELGDRLRDLKTPAELAFAAAETLGRALGVSRAGYGAVDPTTETITIERDWTAPGVQSLAGALRFSDYGAHIEDLKAGETVVFADAEADPRASATADALKAISAPAVVTMPVSEQGGLVALLYLNHETAREWSDEELALIREVAERTRAAIARRAAEEELAESEARYRQIVEGAEDFAIVTLDERGLITSWNAGAERIVGYAEDEAVGRPGAIFFTPEDNGAGAPDHEMNRASSDGRAANERWHLKKDGSRFWGSGLTMRLDQENGGYLKIFRDRTAEHEAEAQLRENAEGQAFRLLLADALRPLGDANEIKVAAATVLGRALGATQVLYGEDQDDGEHVLLLSGYVNRAPNATGMYRYEDYGRGWRASLGSGETLASDDIANDPEFEGGRREAFLSLQIRAVLVIPLIKAGRLLALAAVHFDQPHHFTDKDIAFASETAERTWAALERARAEAALRESEARQAVLLSLADALRALKTPAEIASAAAERLGERFGLNRVFYAEYFGSLMKVERDFARGVTSIVGEHDLEAFGPELLRAYHERPIVKVDDVATDPRLSGEARAGLQARQVGAYLDVVLFEEEQWVSLLALQSATPRTWTASEEGLFREVGERVRSAIERARAEDRLRELNETLELQVAERTAALRRYHDIVDATMASICAFDADYRLIAFNRAHNDAFRRVNGFDTKIGDVFPDLFIPEQSARMRALMTRALTGERFTVREAFGRPELAAPCWEITYTPLLDEGGRVVGAFHHAIDISARLVAQAELEAAQDALRQSQKMEAMGQLTGGVAHDFNNLLTPIVGSLDMLQRRGVGGEREQRLIAGAAQSAERAKTLVQRLLAFARRQPLQPVPVDVAKLVHGMGDLVSSTTGPQVRVLVEAPDDLPPAKADPNQLEMALLNLSVNARDAMPDNGTLRISASAEHVGPGHRSNLRPGRYIRLSVADTGSGMDEATIARVVEPFFSTKGVGKGTGLGLSMVHGLASQLGGALTIQSRLGLGTNVELWLPLSEGAPEPPESAADGPMLPAARGTALLVDDEELVRMSTADMLSDLGYSVIEAASAEEAVKLVGEGKRFDLLVTDHLMPGMNGADLARAIQTARPGVPVLLVSGYAEREGIAPDLHRLIKPFRKDELAASLAQLQGGA